MDSLPARSLEDEEAATLERRGAAAETEEVLLLDKGAAAADVGIDCVVAPPLSATAAAASWPAPGARIDAMALTLSALRR